MLKTFSSIWARETQVSEATASTSQKISKVSSYHNKWLSITLSGSISSVRSFWWWRISEEHRKIFQLWSQISHWITPIGISEGLFIDQAISYILRHRSISWESFPYSKIWTKISPGLTSSSSVKRTPSGRRFKASCTDALRTPRKNFIALLRLSSWAWKTKSNSRPSCRSSWERKCH